MIEDIKNIVQAIRLTASENDDSLTTTDVDDLYDAVEVGRDRLFEAADMIEQLTAELEQTTRERDAAIRELHNGVYHLCISCKSCRGKDGCEKFGKRDIAEGEYVAMCGQYEWRGPCAQNGGVE